MSLQLHAQLHCSACSRLRSCNNRHGLLQEASALYVYTLALHQVRILIPVYYCGNMAFAALLPPAPATKITAIPRHLESQPVCRSPAALRRLQFHAHALLRMLKSARRDCSSLQQQPSIELHPINVIFECHLTWGCWLS
jgi:hypothetical protein